MEESKWLFLPSHIVIDIFSYLNKRDRYRASLVCKYWNDCFHSSYLWTTFQFNFDSEKDISQLKFLDEYATVLKTLVITLNQSKGLCREFACRVLKYFALLPSRRLENLTISFTGQNPLLYSGLEFHEAITDLFANSINQSDSKCSTLREVDLSGLKINLDPSLLYLLALHHSETLRELNIQNGVLAANYHPDVIRHLVSQCHQLTHLHLYGSSLNDDVICELSKPKCRRQLKILSIFFRRDQKYAKDVSSMAWASLVTFSPKLKVTLGFDHTCIKRNLAKVMKPEIPVSTLLFETRKSYCDEIKIAASRYSKTLEELVVFSPPQYDSSLDEALIHVVDCCKSLTSLHVLSILNKETIDYILDKNEHLKASKSYTLHSFQSKSAASEGFSPFLARQLFVNRDFFGI